MRLLIDESSFDDDKKKEKGKIQEKSEKFEGKQNPNLQNHLRSIELVP